MKKIRFLCFSILFFNNFDKSLIKYQGGRDFLFGV